jgi:hypothetical protein
LSFSSPVGVIAYIKRASILRPADERRPCGVAKFDISLEHLISIRPETKVTTFGIRIDEQALDRLRAIPGTIKAR